MKPRICILNCIDESVEDMQYLLKILTKAAPRYKFIITNKPITSIPKEELIKHIQRND